MILSQRIQLIVSLLLLFLASNISAQLNTSGYRVDQTSTNVEVCRGATLGNYTVTAKTSTLNNFQIQLSLPPGISYDLGSATITSSPVGYTITEVNTSNLQQPILAISNGGVASAFWGVGHQVSFSVGRSADCASVAYSLEGSTFKDTISINYEDAGNSRSGINSDTTYGVYNVDFASLSVLAIPTISTTINRTETRNITIRQGGNSCIQRYQHYVVVGRDIDNYQLSFGATALTPTSTVANGSNTADTLFYTINLNNAPFAGAVGNGDNCFDNGEDIVFGERVTILACDNITVRHHARWGCVSSEVCQEAAPQTGAIAFINGATSLTITEIGGATAPELCDTIEHVLRISNNTPPTVPAGGSAAYDVAVIFGLGSNGSPIATPDANTLWGSDRNDTRYWGNFLIGTTPVVATGILNQNGNTNLGTASLLIQDMFTTDIDGPGGLTDLDGDGFFDDLPPGESFDITFNYWINPRENCGIGRGDYMIWEHKYFDVSFKDQCLQPRAPTRRDLGYRNIIRDYLNSTFTSQPTDVFDGQPFTVGIMPHFYNNGYQCRGENMFTGSAVKWSISLDLPAGVTASSVVSNLDSEFSSYNPTITQVGNTVTYTLDRYVYDTLHFDLSFDCATYTSISPTTSIPYTSHYFCGTPGDTCFYREVHCGSLDNILTHCPTNCSGPVIYSFDASRTTPGYTNNTQTTLVTLDPAIHKTKFYNPFDTMLVQARAYMNDTAVNNLLLTLNMTASSGGTDLLTFVGGEVLINDVSAASGYRSFVLDGMPTNLTNVGGQNFEYLMDLSRYVDSMSATYLYGGDDGSVIYSPDSIYVRARFILGSNFGTTNPHEITPFRANFSTLAANGSAIVCDSLGDLAQYEQVSVGWGNGNVRTTTHCAVGLAQMYMTHAANTGDDHPNEYRPPTHWDSTKFVVPSYVYSGTRFSWSNASGTVLPHRIDGDTVTIFRPTTGYSDRDKRQTYYPSFLAGIIGNCETPASQTIRGINYYKDFAYHPDPTVHQSRVRTANATVLYVAPTWAMQALTPSVDGVQDTVRWDYELCNTNSASDIDFNWFFIEPQPNIHIQAIYDITTGTEVSLNYTISNDSTIVEIGAMNSNTCRQFRIYATYDDCSNQALSVNHGWNCQSYPADYSAITSSCYRNLNLLLEPRPSEVQLSIITQPEEAQNLCTDTTFVVQVSNAQLADLTEPTLEVRGITGVVFSSITVEYPSGSGNIETLTPALTPSVATINLLDHTQIAANEGIKGTANAATPEERFVTIRMQVQFVCDFSPNSSLSFAANGNQPCGTPAIGNAVKTKTKAVQINGAVAPYNAFTGTSVSPSPINVEYCSNASTVRIQTTIIGDTTANSDTTEVFLPPGTTYVPNSFSCSSTFCPTMAFLDTTNGRVRVVFPIPSGVPSGNTLDYTFQMEGTAGGGCSNNEELEVNSYVIAGNINCQGTPCGPVKIITGEAEEQVIIAKPDLVLSNLNGRSYQLNSSQEYTVTQQITNNGLDVASSSLTIDYYCVDAMGNPIGSPIGNTTVTSAITNGQTLFDTAHFSVPTPTPCSNETALYSTMVPSASQCICETTAARFSNLLLAIDFASFEAKLTTPTTAQLDWEATIDDNNTTFEVEMSLPNNTVPKFFKVTTVAADQGQENYTYTIPNLIAGTHYFRIKTIEADGSISYSSTKALTVIKKQALVSIYPNPTKDVVQLSITDLANENVSVEIFNSLGQKVLQTSTTASITPIDVSLLASGSYVMKITSESVSRNFKLIISKS
mgnify:CR=1 FL=1